MEETSLNTMWLNHSLMSPTQATSGNSTTFPPTNFRVLAVFFLLTAVSVVGNSLVIYTWYSKMMPRRDTFTYIANLAKSDLLLTSSSLMFLMQDGRPTSVGNVMCKTGQFLGEISSFTSALTLVAIGHHRYSIMTSPKVATQAFTTTVQINARRRCWVIWLIAVVFAAPVTNAFSMIATPTGARCLDTYNWPVVYRQVYYTLRFVLFFCFPLFYLIFSYYHIYLVLRNHSISHNAPRSMHTKLYVAIVTTFFCCVGPKIIARTVEQFKPSPLDVSRIILQVTGLLLVALPAVNPIIYSISSPEIRRAFKNSFRFCTWKSTMVKNEPKNGSERKGVGIFKRNTFIIDDNCNANKIKNDDRADPINNKSPDNKNKKSYANDDINVNNSNTLP